MDTAAMDAVMEETQRGELIFPEVVRRLMEVGVESYFVDFIAATETMYLATGETYQHGMTVPGGTMEAEFSQAGIVAAIRGAQADTVRYPEFVVRSRAAGVAGYWAFLTGRKVIYFGRKGETHTEHFPAAD